MKATEIFNQPIVTSNASIDDSLDPKIIEALCVHNDRLSYDYERLYNSGKLLKILKTPKKAMTNDITCRIFTADDECSHPGFHLMKGADFILPLVFLHNALIARLEKETKETEVIIWPGIRGDVVTDVMENWETEGYLEDIKAIYNLHYNLTRNYYKNHVERMSEEDCKKLLAEIEELDICVAVLQ